MVAKLLYIGPMPEYAVLDKDTIKNRIMPYLSVAKRGFPHQPSRQDMSYRDKIIRIQVTSFTR